MATDFQVGAVAGTKLYIGTSESIASPDDYIEITNIANLGDVMVQFSKIVVESVGDGYTRQIKGTASAPTFDLVMNLLDSDLGQIALKNAAADRNGKYNFKVQDNDLALVGGITPTITTFKGRVYASGRQYGGVNDLKKITTSIEIEPDTIVTTLAT